VACTRRHLIFDSNRVAQIVVHCNYFVAQIVVHCNYVILEFSVPRIKNLLDKTMNPKKFDLRRHKRQLAIFNCFYSYTKTKI
jgi:hypothetical protein